MDTQIQFLTRPISDFRRPVNFAFTNDLQIVFVLKKLVENIKQEGFCAVSSRFCVGLVSNAHDLNEMLILEF